MLVEGGQHIDLECNMSCMQAGRFFDHFYMTI